MTAMRALIVLLAGLVGAPAGAAGRHLADDEQVLEHVRAGELAWQKSCPLTPVDGLCVKLAALPAAPRCPGAPTAALVAVKRRAAQVAQARRQLEAAVALLRRLDAGHGLDGLAPLERQTRVEALRPAVARLELALADLAFEDLLRVPPLRNPDDQKALSAWLQTLWKQYQAARAGYLRFTDRDRPWLVASAERVGHLGEAFRGRLYGLPIPPSVRKLGQPTMDTYCHMLDEATQRVVEESREAYAYCAKLASEAAITSAAARRCQGKVAPPIVP
jgi:hypothetical protein